MVVNRGFEGFTNKRFLTIWAFLLDELFEGSEEKYVKCHDVFISNLIYNIEEWW